MNNKKIYLFTLLLALGIKAQVYNNGNIASGTVSKNSITAPSNSQWSELQSTLNATNDSNGTVGFACFKDNTENIFLADDFIVPQNEKWKINSLNFYAYFGTLGSSSEGMIDKLRFAIYNTNPSTSGATPIYGDLETNRFSSISDESIYRIFNSSYPSNSNNFANTQRKVKKISGNTNVELQPGTYWIVWQYGIVDNNSPFYYNKERLFSPAVTILNQRNQSSSNGLQFNQLTNSWSDALDNGISLLSTPKKQDFPFIINYTKGTLGTNEALEYNNAIALYPNPSQDYFSLNYHMPVSKISLGIYDSSGKLIKTFNKIQDKYSIKDLEKGTYFVKIQLNNSIKTEKLIKN